MKNDIDKLDELPLRENRASYITRKYGDMWDLNRFDHPWFRNYKSEYAWVKAERIIKKFIGKNYDKAFSEYCKLVKPYEQDVFYNDFFKNGTYYKSEYIIDKQKRIQLNKERIREDNKRRLKRKEGGVWFYSIDYQTAYMHRVTGEILSRKDYNWYNWYDNKHCYRNPLDRNYVEVIVSGFEKHFKSEKDPEYIRLNAEKIKQKALYQKLERKEKRAKTYNFMSKAEIARKKIDALDAQKIQSHGFDESSFKGVEYHGQKRKSK